MTRVSPNTSTSTMRNIGRSGELFAGEGGSFTMALNLSGLPPTALVRSIFSLPQPSVATVYVSFRYR